MEPLSRPQPRHPARQRGLPAVHRRDRHDLRANFVSSILEVHARRPRQALVVCACSDLPQRVPERDYALSDFEWLRAQADRRKSIGTGACQSATREFFFHARGYDEAFVHWGSEDTDMRDRALAYGLELEWISDRTEMFHQWHPTSRYSRLIQNRKNASVTFSRGTRW
nr:galactosyltransferase-related protein [Pseudenhygromyxa sp. WMMC2535]